MKRILPLLILALAQWVGISNAFSANEVGVPPGQTWNYRQLRVGDVYPELPFFWLVQGRNGLLYLSDQRGILEYDGASWRRLPLKIDSTISTIGLAQDGALIVGGAELLQHVSFEDGVVKATDIGALVPGKLRGLGFFWEIGTDGRMWCARSEPAIICDTPSGIKTFQGKKNLAFGRLFELDGELVVPQVEFGMVRITETGLQEIPELAPVAKEGIYTIVAVRPEQYMALTKNTTGFWTWTKGQLPTFRRSEAIARLAPPIGQGVAIGGGLAAFPEENGSVVVLDDTGKLVDRIGTQDPSLGLGAQSLLRDHEGGLWIVWRNAVMRVDYPSRLNLFALPISDASATYRVARTHMGVTTHFGTDVFAISQENASGSWGFKKSEQSLPNILFVDTIGSDSFAGTINGLFDLRTNQHLANEVYVYSITPKIQGQFGIWVGARFGVKDIKRGLDGAWQENSELMRISFEVTSIVQTDAQTLWLGSEVGRVARIRLDSNQSLKDATFDEYDTASGLPNLATLLTQLGGRLIVATAGGSFEWQDDRFVLSPQLPFSETGPIERLAAVDDDQILVVGPKGRIRLLQRDISGVFRHSLGIFDEIVGIGRIGNVMLDHDSVVWLSTDIGLIRVDPKVQVAKAMRQQVLIRELVANDKQLSVSARNQIVLPESSSIRVGYALPSFRDPESNQYRSRIRAEGQEAAWSAWTNESRRDFTNLPAGQLVFEVEARDAAAESGGTAAILITVVAPWYRRPWAVAVFLVSGSLLLLFAVQWRVRALRARSAELERLVAIKTEALQIAATTDPLTGLWNRHRFGQWMRDEVPKINARAGAAGEDERVDLITCVIDLDHFKRVNDQHGHAAGDAVLKAVAERLQGMRENGDLVFRFGGEEFVYVGVHRHRSEGKKLAERIVHEIAQINVELDSGVLLDPTASVGWSVYPFYRERPDLFTLDFVLGVADRALYLAKQVGRNRAYGYVANIAVDEIDRTQADWRAQVFNRHADFLKRV